jgi:hypothetical protein
MAKKKTATAETAELAKTIQISPQKKAALTRIGEKLIATANSIEVNDQPSFEVAGEFLKGCKASQKSIHNEMDPIAQNAHKAWKGITGMRAKLLSPIEAAEGIVKGKIATYLDEIERVREDEARRLEAEALEGPDELIDDPSIITGGRIAAVALRSAPAPKVEGISSRKVYSVSVDDLPKFLEWAIAGGTPAAYVTPNISALNDLARRTEGKLEVPGCTVHTSRSVASRSS